jgi:hypothetical protein
LPGDHGGDGDNYVLVYHYRHWRHKSLVTVLALLGLAGSSRQNSMESGAGVARPETNKPINEVLLSSKG